MKIMIVVTHLLGTGHLARALNLGRAFLTAGHETMVISGGTPVAQLDRGDVPLVQLPPLCSDGVNFSRLLDMEGHVADAGFLTKRRDILLDHYARFQPDVLITELYPFGRRILREEFTALLMAARARTNPPLICASIRDILAPPSSPQKAAKTEAVLQDFYDAVLVHADASVTPLDLSWPVTSALQAKLHYTGFVAPPAPAPHPKKVGAHEIIVTAGGGDVGAHIFAAAREAATLSNLQWRILLGGADAANRAAALSQEAPANVIIEAARPDFRQMLHHATAVVSMCGYNTALDLLQTGCPAVLIPFDAGDEVEQSIRAKALADLPAMQVIRSAELSAETLLEALGTVSAAPRRPAAQVGFGGAQEALRIIERLKGKAA